MAQRYGTRPARASIPRPFRDRWRCRRRATLVEVQPHTRPECPRRARRDRVFTGPLARVGAHSAIRVKGVPGQEPRRGILLVQYVYDTGEKIDGLSEVIDALQINDRVARNPARASRRDEGALTIRASRPIGIVFIAVQIGA